MIHPLLRRSTQVLLKMVLAPDGSVYVAFNTGGALRNAELLSSGWLGCLYASVSALISLPTLAIAVCVAAYSRSHFSAAVANHQLKAASCLPRSAGSSAITVRRWDGTAWSTVGSAGFITGMFIGLAVDSSNTPYMATGDASTSNKGRVMRFAGSSWAQVGQAYLSIGNAYWSALAFNANGRLFYAYQDAGNSHRVSTRMVKRCKGRVLAVAHPVLKADATSATQVVGRIAVHEHEHLPLPMQIYVKSYDSNANWWSNYGNNPMDYVSRGLAVLLAGWAMGARNMPAR